MLLCSGAKTFCSHLEASHGLSFKDALAKRTEFVEQQKASGKDVDRSVGFWVDGKKWHGVGKMNLQAGMLLWLRAFGIMQVYAC